MLESLHWRGTLDSPEAAAQLHELRADSLRLFLALTAAGYLAWHFAGAMLSPDDVVRRWLIVPVVLPVLIGTHVLLPASRRAATAVFVGGSLLAITWALYVLDAAQAALLYAVLALAAAFVTHPLGGFAVVGAAVGMLGLVDAARPGLVGPADILGVVVFAGLAVVGVWALMHRLLLVLNWYVDSYTRAERRTREAEEQRAQLVQAWKQLDSAYYRLERANAALRLAWEAADVAERSKMELATNISHELRTPLNLIVGYSEMMMTSPSSYGNAVLPVPYRIDLNAIYRSAQHLLALTDDVLDLARMEVGRLGLLREPGDLGQVIRDAASLVKEYVEAKGLDLRVELPDGVPTLLFDRLRIRQVLLNLLTNAARLTERGQIEVRLLLREHDVQVSVADTGPGIAPEDQPRVFERFVTRDAARTDGRGGTGLGLPISKRFVELHGGDMGVESRLGVGTAFWFTLPLAPAAGSGLAPGGAHLAPAYSRQQEQVLVLAEADPGLARLLQRYLEGYRVESADGLVGAEARALDLRASAIIADLETPVDGRMAPTPVVRCPLPRLGRLSAGLGVADYLVKPISREALLAAIAKVDRPVSRVLVVDDDAWFAQLLSRMLASDRQRYVTSVAHGGEEALARMRSDVPDLLLLDLAMPGLDGLGVLSEMAVDPGLRAVSVIVISGHGEGEGAVPLGTEIRIGKPEGFQLAELTQVVGAVLSKLASVRGYLVDAEPAIPEARPG